MSAYLYLKGVTVAALEKGSTSTEFRPIYIYLRVRPGDKGKYRKDTGFHVRECDWVEKKNGKVVKRLNPRITGAQKINDQLEELLEKVNKLRRLY